MWLKNLQIQYFRNYKLTEIDFHPGLNIFLGENAQGKTNILEAIYFLAFKMLGTSIHMLQVVGVVPLHLIRFIPTVEILGIYANWEVFISQVIFIILIVLITLKRKK